MTKRPPWVSIIHIPREQIRAKKDLIRSLACFLKVPQPLSLDWIWGVGSSSATRGIGALSCVEGNNGSSIFHEDDLAGSGLKAPSTEDHEQSWRSLIETRGCQRSLQVVGESPSFGIVARSWSRSNKSKTEGSLEASLSCGLSFLLLMRGYWYVNGRGPDHWPCRWWPSAS